MDKKVGVYFMVCYIVEGKRDVFKIKQIQPSAFFVVLNGNKLTFKEKCEIKDAIEEFKNVYILTDPDEPGNLIADRIIRVFPTIKRIQIEPNKACMSNSKRIKYGVEYCSNEYLRKVLKKYKNSPNKA
jgi:ribonuclease M5